MNRKKKMSPLMVIPVVILACGLALADEAWIHVRVDSDGARGESVRVNVPFSLVENLLPAIDVEPLRGGRLVLDEIDLEGVDLRAILKELASVEDADFVKVRDGDETVSVSKKDGFLHVDVDEDGGGTRVRIRMPVSIVDALVTDEGEANSLDIAAAMRVLRGFEGDLVTVQDGDETVRVWIDTRNSIDE